MKKLFTLIFVFMFCFSFASAFDFNEVEFIKDSSTSKWGKYEIYDSQLLIFRGDKLADYELINNGYSVLDGWAYLDVELYADEQLFSELNLYDKKNNPTTLRELKISYAKLETKEIEVTIYGKICNNQTINGRLEQTCIDNEIGKEKKEISEWVWREYKGEILEVGKYKIRIEGKRDNLKTGLVDWIGTTGAGKKELKEWAVWWDTDWNNKQAINFSSQLEINDSVKITIPYDADMLSNFSDLRFSNKGETAELDYWFNNNSFIDSTSVDVWIRTTEQITTAENIYMYYGNPIADSKSNISNAFLFADDFNGGFIDWTNKWESGAQQFYSVFDSVLNITDLSPTGTSDMRMQDNYNNYEVGFRIKATGVADCGVMIRNISQAWSNPTTIGDGLRLTSANKFNSFWNAAPTDLGTGYGTAYWIGNIDIPLTGNGNITVSYENETLYKVGTGTPTFRDSGVYFSSWTASDCYLDWIYLKNYKEIEPSYSFGAEQTQNALTITLNSPVNGFNSTSNSLVLNCSSIDDVGVINQSLIIDGSFNNTIFNTTSNQNLSIALNITIIEENYNWTCQACDNDECKIADTRNFRIHTTPATINILEPNATVDFLKIGNNQTLRWKLTETGQNLSDHIKNCSYIYNEIETQINLSDCLIVNTTSFLYVQGVNNLTFSTIEEFGIVSTSFTSWTYSFLELNQTFVNKTIEGSTETFSIAIQTSGTQISTASLIYNNTINSATFSSLGDDKFSITKDLVIPSVTTDSNRSFFWNIILSDDSNINSSTNNQTVQNIGIDNCTSNSNVIFNFTVLDEEFQTILSNVTIEVALNLFPLDRSILISNLSFSSSINPTQICLSTNLTASVNYSLDAIIKYEEISHAIEYYNIVDFDLNKGSSFQDIKLFDLNLSDSTEFKITFKDSSSRLIEDALVFINRQYVAEDTFKTVEIPLTDSNSETIGHFVRNDIVYNILVIKEGEVMGSFENIRVFCDDFTIDDCVLPLEATEELTIPFEFNEQSGLLFSSNPSFNNETKVMTFTYATTSGSTEIVTMNVERQDVFGNRSLCSDTLTSASGTLSCIVPSTLDDTLLVTTITLGNSTSLITNTQINRSNFGSIGYLAWFILSLVLILAVGDDKTGIFFGMLISYIGAVALGLINRTLFGSGAAGIWIIAITIIGIWQLNKENPQ